MKDWSPTCEYLFVEEKSKMVYFLKLQKSSHRYVDILGHWPPMNYDNLSSNSLTYTTLGLATYGLFKN